MRTDSVEFPATPPLKSPITPITLNTTLPARLVGAKEVEVCVMNTLTINLHLMMVSFYRPTKTKFKILVEAKAFPSDMHMLQSQVKFHGFDPEEALVKFEPREGEATLRTGMFQVERTTTPTAPPTIPPFHRSTTPTYPTIPPCHIPQQPQRISPPRSRHTPRQATWRW